MRVDRHPCALPRTPHDVGSAGEPAGGGSPDRFDRVPKTGPALTDPFFGTGRCGPVVTRESFPRTPHDVGECRGSRGGAVQAGLTEFPKRALPSPTRILELGDADR